MAVIVLDCLLTGLLVMGAWRLEKFFRLFKVRKFYTAGLQPPSVSVCIPARNENHAMTECLENVLASDYKKMEIIVFDDSSNDDTSALVRSFAYAGVRFVPGDTLPDGWLGKNHALEILAREASGTYIIFLDVDTRIHPATISRLVSYMLTEKLAMASVLPGRNDTWRASALFGTLRYFWQLTLSRPRAPATSSSLWVIDRQVLMETLGGFAAYKATVQPEVHIAADLGTRRYHCLINHSGLVVNYEKKWRSQLEASRRLLYPMTGGRWWQVGGFLLMLIVANVPSFALLSGLFFGWSEVQVMGLWFVLLYMALYAVYTSHMWHRRWWLGGLLWPMVIFQELLLFIGSIWGYMRGTITWKGRLVTKGSLRSSSIRIDQ